jgi:WD40 repeat protein
MNRASWLLIPTLAIVCTPLLSAPQTQTESDALSKQRRTEYESWIQSYRAGPLRANFGDQKSEVKLVITAIEGDERKPDDPPRSLFRPSHEINYGCSVSTDGRLSFFSYTAIGRKSSGYPTMPEADLKRLNQLLADLPDDFSQLPPPDRRIVLQVSVADQVIARVYDRANTPEKILEILRLTRSQIKSWVLKFQPQSQWTAEEPNNHGAGALALSPDGRQVISAGVSGTFPFWDPDSSEMLSEVPRSAIGTIGPSIITRLTLSADGSVAAVERWGEIDLLDTRTWRGIRKFSEPFVERNRHQLSNPQFTPDGRYLLLQSNEPALQIFETKTWQRRPTLPGMPVGVLAYFPAPSGQRSVYLAGSGAISLWNPKDNRDIGLLDDNGRIVRLAFSPDESMVAAVTLHKAGEMTVPTIFRVRIWKTDNGALLQEMRPFERSARSVDGLLWWPDGKYLLAVTKSDSIFTTQGIGIWNVKTGRHRGQLVGCSTNNIFGLVLHSDGRVFEGCGDGIIRVWDTPKTLEQITAFEASLLNNK